MDEDRTYLCFAPNGARIVSEAVNTPGSCAVSFYAPNVEGLDFTDGTNHGYDGQDSETIGGEFVFYDDDGVDWLGCHLRWIEEGEAAPDMIPTPIIARMREQIDTGRVKEKIDEALALAEPLRAMAINGPLVVAAAHANAAYALARDAVGGAILSWLPRPEPEYDAATLSRGLIDMINQGRLTPAMIPDDFEWLSAVAHAVAEAARGN